MRRQEPDKMDLTTTSQLFKAVKGDPSARARGRNNRETVSAPLGDAAKTAAENAAYAAFMALPVYSGFGLLLMVGKPKGDVGSVMKAISPLLTIGGFVVDVIKFPFCLVYATEEAARAGLTKIASAIIEKTPEREFEKRMLESFIIRLIQTAKLLCALGLDTAESMQAKLSNADIDDLIGLTLLHTAFASRYVLDGTLLLANGKSLTREDCPEMGRALFDTCHEAKQVIKDALGEPTRIDDALHLRDSQIVCKWIPYIRKGEQVKLNDMPDADPNDIVLLNRLIALINPLCMQAKAILPVEVKEVSERVGKFQMK